MNYYEHHIGDYAQATSHLSFVEDAAYSRLIRKYYAEEKPLPTDLRAVQRLVGARSDEEREAVETVLGEFFTLEADGWHSKRCDVEIERYREKQDKARASANSRWSRRNASASDLDAFACLCYAFASEPHNGRNAHQSPDPSLQTPDISAAADTVPGKPSRKKPETPLPENFEVSGRVKTWAAQHGFTDRLVSENFSNFVLWAKSKDKRYADWDAALMTAIRKNWADAKNVPFEQQGPIRSLYRPWRPQ